MSNTRQASRRRDYPYTEQAHENHVDDYLVKLNNVDEMVDYAMTAAQNEDREAVRKTIFKAMMISARAQTDEITVPPEDVPISFQISKEDNA